MDDEQPIALDRGSAHAEAHRLNLRHGPGHKAVSVGGGRWAITYRRPKSRRRRRGMRTARV